MDSKSKSRYSLIYLSLAGLHALYLAIFLYAHSTIMIVFNILSISLYLFLGFTASKAASLLKHFIICFLEILVNTILSSMLCGMECGFSLVLLGILPIVFYSVHMLYRQGKNDGKLAMLDCIIIAFVYYLTWFLDFFEIGRRYYLSNSTEHMFYFINMSCTLMVLVGFLTVFVLRVNDERQTFSHEKEEIETSANIDPLTKLLNRRSLDKYLERAFRRVSAYDADFSILMCDIDNFKHVNDTYGHECGDEVLKNISAIIKNTIRSEDVAFRWGGEEILIMINAKSHVARTVAERCRKSIEESSVTYKDQVIKVTITIGGVSYYQGATKDELIEKADGNLYFGKNNGKNQVVM